MAKPTGPEIVCGEVPLHDVTWKISLVDPSANPVSVCFEDARTAFSAYQQASPKLGNPAFSDVVCVIVDEDPELSTQAVPKKKKRKKT